MNTPKEQSEQDTTDSGIGIGIGPKKREQKPGEAEPTTWGEFTWGQANYSGGNDDAN